MANRTFLKLTGGTFAEERTVEVSTGAPDANKIPNVNAAGVLERSVVNAVQASAGVADAGKVAALDSAGKLDTTMMPVGLSADSLVVTTSEALSAGALVNLHNSAGLRARNADAATNRVASGFVNTAVGSGASATVFFEGTITGLTAKTPGATQFVGTAGALTETAPSTATQMSQQVGVASGTTSVSFEPQLPVLLA